MPESYRGGVLSIGNFDGVHRGHSRLLALLRALSRRLGVPAVVVSFEPHPVTLLRPDLAPPPLCWPERKVRLLEQAGADRVIILRTTHELLQLTAEQFFTDVVLARFLAKGLVEGASFGFGRNRAGNITLLAEWCRQSNVPLQVVESVRDGPDVVSSSHIRECLRAGEVARARAMLGRPHRLRGEVAAGFRRGATIGVPTANLERVDVLAPKIGVYAVRVHAGGEWFAGACNIGPSPTVGVEQVRIEVHLLDFDGDLYGKTIEIEFFHRLRDVQAFAGLDRLKEQLQRDIAAARTIAESETAYDPSDRAELARTIAEWVKHEIEPGFALLGGRLAGVRWREDRVLNVHWSLPSALTPGDTHVLLHQLDERLRSAFPEVRAVEPSGMPWASDASTRRFHD